MPQVLPEVDVRRAEARPAVSAAPAVLPYAAPGVNDNLGGAFAMAGLGCSAAFVGLIVVAGVAHPRIETPLLGIIIAAPLAALVFGAVASRRAKRAGRKEPGSARAAVWLGGGELALLLAFGVMIPSMCRATEPANRAKCSNNLRQIGLALLTYANTHGGQFPHTLNILLTPDEGAEITADVFTCPSSSDERAMGQTPAEIARNLTAEPGHLSYVYVGAGLTNAPATADRIVAYDNPHNHTDGMNILYGDAHVEFLERKRADPLIARLGAGGAAPATRPAGASR